jgi:putative peptidoglycan lipid II flippase
LRYAIIRVTLTTLLGYVFALPLPIFLGINPKWGVAGLTASAGIAGWVEFALLRRTLNRRIGKTGLAAGYVIKLWLAASIGAGIGWGLRVLVGDLHPIPLASIVLGGYGISYFAITSALGIPASQAIVNRLLRLTRLKN